MLARVFFFFHFPDLFGIETFYKGMKKGLKFFVRAIWCQYVCINSDASFFEG